MSADLLAGAVRALCCVCGTLRIATTQRGNLVPEARPGQEAGGRCLVARKCATCRETTAHAYLRDLPAEAWCRDAAELAEREQYEQMRARLREMSGWDMGPWRG
jgi:hypothetical protein